MKKSVWLILGLLYLVVLEIVKVYFIMPFPGSQQHDSIAFAYFIHHYIWWLRIVGLVVITGPLLRSLAKGKVWQRTLVVIAILLYAFIIYLFNFRFLADKIFREPTKKIFATPAQDTTSRDKLVIGVVIGREARAYPIQLIGYHHQVRDEILHQPVMVTYCTVCRTGRVYSPLVQGKPETFRLVGMDHFNAMFEDATTKSWWQQATGIAVAGRLKGAKLTEIPSAQMRLGEWLALYPDSKILQADTVYKKQYAELKNYDGGKVEGKLERRDSSSWNAKSWVVGITVEGKSKAYDWNRLMLAKLVNDSIGTVPVLLAAEDNGKTFYAFNRMVNGVSLRFRVSATEGLMEDEQTHSTWKRNGSCIQGLLQGRQLARIQAYQEFWHSWKNFHPHTETY